MGNWRGIVVVAAVSAAAVFAVPGVAACQLPEVTGCDPEPVPEGPVPEPELPVEPPAVLPPDTDAAEARLLVLINDDRRAHGLHEVSARADVEDIAEGHSAAMASARDIWHNDAYFSAAMKRRLGAARVGENVALNRDPDDAHRKLMASPLHRANILDAGFTTIGIAAAADEEGRLYITEDFVEPVRVAAVPTPPKAVTAAAPAPRPPAVAAPPAAVETRPLPVVDEEPDASHDGFEVALGPTGSLPNREDSGRPWPAYLVAGALLLAATVGLRRAAC